MILHGQPKVSISTIESYKRQIADLLDEERIEPEKIMDGLRM